MAHNNEGNNINGNSNKSSTRTATVLQPIPRSLVRININTTSTDGIGSAATNIAYQPVIIRSDNENRSKAYKPQRRRIGENEPQKEVHRLLPNGVTQNHNRYNYPVTWTIIVAMHALQYYRTFYGIRQQQRQQHQRRTLIRGRTRRCRRRNVTNQSPNRHHSIERKVPWSYVTYDILIQKKQWYKWCLSILSIQQYYSTTSLLLQTTPTLRNDDSANTVGNPREHWWRSSSRSTHRGWNIPTLRIQIQRCTTNTLRQCCNHFRAISHGITRCLMHIREIVRILQRHYNVTSDNDRTPLERIQYVYADLTLYYYQSTITYTYQIHSIILLFYVTYLLWSCRLLEYYYIYFYHNDHLDPQLRFDLDIENVSRNSSSGSTVIHHDYTGTLVPTISWHSIMTYVRVWIGIAITITMLEVFIRYFFLQVLYQIRYLLIHVVIVRRQEDREQPQQQPSESPPLFGETEAFSATSSERPDIIPLYPNNENDTDDHNNRLDVHLDTIAESLGKLRSNLMCVNMIQMISSLLMIYRCTIVNYYKNSHSDAFLDNGEDMNLLGHYNTNNIPVQYLYRPDWIPSKMISPVPCIWPTFVFGTNISYATCLLLLYWLSLTPLIPNVIVLEQQQGRPHTISTSADIPETDTDNRTTPPKKKSSSLHTVHSIMNGTLVGWLWGNSYFMTPTLATPYFGNAIFMIVLVGSLIALKARYPNVGPLHWLSSVGCNRKGHPLTFDPHQNRWIDDSVDCIDAIQINDEDDDTTDNERSESGDEVDDGDIEVGHIDQDQWDDDDNENNFDNSTETVLQQQEMTSLLNSFTIPNNFRSRRNTTIASGI